MATESLIESVLSRWEVDPGAARAALVDHSRGRLAGLAHRMLREKFRRVGNLEETDDVVQGAQVRLLRALESVRPMDATAFFGLAAAQVRRELLDLARHHYGPHGQGTRQRPLAGAGSAADGESPDVAGGTTYDPLNLAIWTEMHARAADLPVDQRSVVDLIYYQGLTRPEAARALGISESSVKRRWLEARLSLGACLAFASSS